MTSSDAAPLWTEGVLGDGAAILRDGVMVPIEEVVRALNRGETHRERQWEERGQDDTARHVGDLVGPEPDGSSARTVILWPTKSSGDSEFLAAIEGYVMCLNDNQEARLSREQLNRLAIMARTGTKRRETP